MYVYVYIYAYACVCLHTYLCISVLDNRNNYKYLVVFLFLRTWLKGHILTRRQRRGSPETEKTYVEFFLQKEKEELLS